MGGTSEASALANRLAALQKDAIFSYAGRTQTPRPQPLPMRVGGFGGSDGLADYIRSQKIRHIIDATHPFAAQMSRNAEIAAAATGARLLRFERPPWQSQQEDDWQQVPDLAAAKQALPVNPAHIFLAIGRQFVAPFLTNTRHVFLLRFVDQPDTPLPDHARLVIDTGPFTFENDLSLLQQHGITHIVAKNSGGSGARAKLDAARHLGIKVILVDRPAPGTAAVLHNIEDAVKWLDQA